MQAAVINGDGTVEVRSVPVPEPGPCDALVKIRACSICNGTDRKLVHGEFPFAANYPAVLGHESVGEVVAVGSRVSTYSLGDLVFRPGATFDEASGLFSLWGGFAEYGTVSDALALAEEGLPVPGSAHMQQVIPEGTDPVEASVLITYKETLSWLRKFSVGPGTSVLIWGTGPVGISFARNAKILGAGPVIVVGRRDAALPRATEAGADVVVNAERSSLPRAVQEATGGKGVDRVVEAVGSYELVGSSLPLLAAGGEVGLYGVPPARAESGFDLASLQRECAVRHLAPDEPATHDQVLDAFRLGFIDPRRDITRVLPLEEIGRGFELLASKEAFKVVVTPG